MVILEISRGGQQVKEKFYKVECHLISVFMAFVHLILYNNLYDKYWDYDQYIVLFFFRWEWYRNDEH